MLKRFQNIFNLLRFLTMEPIIFITMLNHTMKQIPTFQMLQDKLCIQRYNLSNDYCHNLPTMEIDPLQMKSIILVDVTQMKLYINIIYTILLIIVSIIIGPLIDQYPRAKRLLLIMVSIMTMGEMTILALNSFFYDISYYFIFISYLINGSCGGYLVSLTTIWSYISSVTPKMIRSLRMVFVELCIIISPPIATTISGNMLNLSTPFIGHELRNYTIIFIIGILGTFINLLISLFLVDEEIDRKCLRKYFPSNEIDEQENRNNETINQSDDIIKNIFKFQNISNMFRTFIRRRKHGIRLQMFLLIICTIIIMFSNFGPTIFTYQYTQKVFAWSSTNYSNYMTVSKVINIITTIILAPLFIKVFKLADLTLALIAIHLILIQNLILSVSSSIWTFYIALPFYSVNSLAIVGVRSYINYGNAQPFSVGTLGGRRGDGGGGLSRPIQPNDFDDSEDDRFGGGRRGGGGGGRHRLTIGQRRSERRRQEYDDSTSNRRSERRRSRLFRDRLRDRYN
ncbi:hypothetical protein RDWZM_010141 [Blomia tropicalis]|uniref:Uncharacterized protein n=1 Tax=Blomia tropicalis TaxID=40697 RepID=A0A9Q0LYR1_BLOTA|nr:hypothetical protein RDWZM_010141 [Blomia tropicalis]